MSRPEEWSLEQFARASREPSPTGATVDRIVRDVLARHGLRHPRAPVRCLGKLASCPPPGEHWRGDYGFWRGTVWWCTAAGSPGRWEESPRPVERQPRPELLVTMPDGMSDADAADYIGRFRERNIGAVTPCVVSPGAKFTELPPMRRPDKIEQREQMPTGAEFIARDDRDLSEVLQLRWTWGGALAGGTLAGVYLGPAIGANPALLGLLPLAAVIGWLAVAAYVLGIVHLTEWRRRP